MDLSIYVHVPFCTNKCNYCDFLSYIYEDEVVNRYLHALKQEVQKYEAYYKDKKIISVYYGGGTPSCLKPDQLTGLFEACLPCIDNTDEQEITCEVNPGTLSKEKLLIMKEAGVNRVSMGAQSFADEYLRYLGRQHRAADIVDTYFSIRRAGIRNINLDLIFALPGQTVYAWRKTMEQASALAPEHISVYNLTVEKGTKFHKLFQEGKLIPVDEETELAMYKEAIYYLSNMGYEHYEISAFSYPGKESRHNLSYWLNKNYLGFGPGAHSSFAGVRWENTGSFEEYRSLVAKGEYPVSFSENLSTSIMKAETMILGLRLRNGVSRSEFSNRFGVDPVVEYKTQLKNMVTKNLICMEGDRIYLSEKGLIFANQAFLEFLP